MESLSIYHSLQTSLAGLTNTSSCVPGTSVLLKQKTDPPDARPGCSLAARQVAPHPGHTGLSDSLSPSAPPETQGSPPAGSTYPRSPVLTAAVNIQARIRANLDGQSPEALLRGLPENSILTVQFAMDPEGTSQLLAQRLQALEQDTADSFHRFGRQREARQLLQQLREQHTQLVRQPSDEALVTLIRGMVDYERTFHKDSWIQMVNMAFLGLNTLREAPRADQLPTLIPPQRLLEDASARCQCAALLAPDPVTKHNAGTLSCNPEGLAHWMTQHLETRGKSSLSGRIRQHLVQLRHAGAPSLLTGEALPTWLEEEHPELTGKLITLLCEHMSYSTDADIRSQGLQLLAQASQADDIQDTLDLLQDSPELAGQLTILVGSFLQQLRITQLDAETRDLLDNQVALSPDALRQLRDRYENAQAGVSPPVPGSRRQLSGIRARLRHIELVPLQQLLTRDSQSSTSDDKLWHLPIAPPLGRVEAAVSGRATDDWAPLIRELHAYLQRPPPRTMEELRHQLQHKDRLMTAQQDYCLAEARRCLGKDPAFTRCLDLAAQIEAARPPWQLISEDMAFSARLIRAGRNCLRHDRMPLAHQVNALRLEHELHGRGYDFNEEVRKLLGDIQHLPGLAGEATAGARRQLTTLLDDWRQGDKSPVQLLQQLAQASQQAREGFARIFHNSLTGAAAIGQASPRTLRALYGNMSQTLTSIGATVGQSSSLYRLWSELHNRVSAEAQTQYFLDALQENGDGPALEQLNEEQLAAVKRLMAINSLLSYSTGVPTVVEGLLTTVTGGLNPLNLAWNAARTGINLLGSRLIGNKVNTLEPEDVKLANATLDILHEGPEAAGQRQQVMEWSGRVMADMACNRSRPQMLANAGILYPFKALFHSFSKAFSAWREGQPGGLLRLAVQAAKTAPVAVPVLVAAGSLLVTPLASMAFVFGLAALPTALFVSWSWAHWVVSNTGLLDIATMALARARKIRSEQGSNFRAEAERLLLESGFRQRIQPMARNHACAALSRRFWESWVQESSENARMAQELDNDFAQQQYKEQEREETRKVFDRLKQVAASLAQLEQRGTRPVTLEWVRSIMPADELKALPAPDQQHHLDIWLMTHQERLRDELHQATGQDALPESETVLQQWITRHNRDRMRGLALLGLCPEAKACMDATTAAVSGVLLARARERTALFMAEGLVKGLTSVFTSRARAGTRRTGNLMRPEEFANILARDSHLDASVQQQFTDVYLAEIRKAGECDHRRLKEQLQAQGQTHTNEQVQQLLEAVRHPG